MTPTDKPKQWIVEDNIIRLMATVDNGNRVWGNDCDLGHVNVIRAMIKKELDQLRREAVEKYQRSRWEVHIDIEALDLAKKEAKRKAVEEFIQLHEKGICNSRITTAMNPIIDKAKRAACVELLDEIITVFPYITSTDYEKFRAKTLGEKKE